jgi:hypothetical protein
MARTEPIPTQPQFSLRALLLATTIVAFIVGLVSAWARYSIRQEALRRAEEARIMALDKATVSTIVREVEAIRAKLGRAPVNEDELETLLGKEMPVVHEYGQERIKWPISYRRTGDDSFRLHYEQWDTDDWIYDSTIPNAGWVQHWC